MATFELKSRWGTSPPRDVSLKPLRELQPVIRRITDLAIPADIQKLGENQRNIAKFRRENRYDKLRFAEMEASKTLKALKQHLAEIDRLKLKVVVDERITFEYQVEKVRNAAFLALQEFAAAQREITEDFSKEGKEEEEEEEAEEEDTSEWVNITSQVSQKDEHGATRESWETLRRELEELSEMMRDYAQMVHAQGKVVDSIENNIATAQIATNEAAKEIGHASILSKSFVPLTGAVIGAVVGGPVGLLAGFKIAGVFTALGGGYLGYKGGKAIKDQHRRKVDKSMRNLSERKQGH